MYGFVSLYFYNSALTTGAICSVVIVAVIGRLFPKYDCVFQFKILQKKKIKLSLVRN